MAMTEEHKQALAKGRNEARAIKAYLKALQARGPGRPVNRETLEKRLASLNEKIEASNDPLKSVDLIQSRLDTEDALASVGDAKSFEDLEAGFVSHVKSYSERKKVSYTAWREFGVPAAVLRNAGVPETRRR